MRKLLFILILCVLLNAEAWGQGWSKQSTRDGKFKSLLSVPGSLKRLTVYIQTDKPVPLGIRAMYPEVTFYPPR